MTHRAAVLGHPVSHSLSPPMHRAAYEALGLDWGYDAIDVTADGLPAFVAGLGPEWAGLSLTMPLKRAVLPLLEGASPLATALGVVNTVTFSPSRGLLGDNTDVHGLVEALRAVDISSVVSGHVLGGGATAASAVAALAELGCTAPVVHVRSPLRAGVVEAAAARLGVTVEVLTLDDRSWSEADVVISTLPAGAADALVGSVGSGLLLDVAYDPWPSRLASAWTAAGGRVVDGFEMLLHQAAAQVVLMTGRPAPVEAMRTAGLAARPHP